MIEKGIIDPVKVTRSALENAICIAGMVLTTNCLVTDMPEKNGAGAMGAGARRRCTSYGAHCSEIVDRSRAVGSGVPCATRAPSLTKVW